MNRPPDEERIIAEAAALIAERTSRSRHATGQDAAGAEIARRAVAAAWNLAPSLAEQDSYRDLLGKPTLRERAVAGLVRWSQAFQLPSNRRRHAFAAGLALAVLGASWLVQTAPAQQSYRTELAQMRALALADGSRVTLGASSKLDLVLKPHERLAMLEQGEAFFEVAPDSSRPFAVLAGGTKITVVGTKFNVKIAGSQVRVAVREGAVRVVRFDATTADKNELRLGAGDQALMAGGGKAPRLEPAPAIDADGWRKGRLSYQNAPLSEIVADVNRYRSQPISIQGEALGEVRLTTSFEATQIDAMLATLPEAVPLKIAHGPSGAIVLKPL